MAELQTLVKCQNSRWSRRSRQNSDFEAGIGMKKISFLADRLHGVLITLFSKFVDGVKCAWKRLNKPIKLMIVS